MRWLRGVLIADPAIILATLFFGAVSFMVSFFDSSGKTQAAVAKVWGQVLLLVSGVRVEVEGLQHIDPQGSYIFMANHTSYMDTPVVLANISVQFRFLAKRGLFQIPFLGSHLHRAGHIPVPRDDPRAAVKTLQLAAETIQKKKISLLVFPEGGRSHDGVLRPFKEGGAYMAIRAGVPIVPLVLLGGRSVLPYGAGVVKAGKVIMHVLEPIETANLSLKDRGELTGRVRALLLEQTLSADRAVH
jgi:1-acyl-sn-glycerol-3-phosphate acyltransferase